MAAIGAEQLATHITDLQTKLRIEQTEQGRIALVGCETDKPSSSGTAAEITSLAQLVAKRLYDSGNGTINAEVTGRTTQIEVNADGTKTMLTGGTKTVYSWDTDKGEITQKTETVKNYSEALKNPLDDFDDHLPLMDEMMQSLDTLIEDEGERKKCYDFLNKLKEDIQQVREMNYESSVEFLREIASDIEENLGTQAIKVKLEKVHRFVQSRIENPFVSSLIDKMYKNKSGSDIDKKLEMLEGMKSELDAYQENQSKYEPAAQNFLDGLRFFIDSSQRSQYALQQWEKFTVPDTHEVSPFSKNTYHVFVQLEDDSVIAEGATFLTGKHFTNSTLIQMDKEGNYLVVHGLSLSEIPEASDIKLVFNGHGNDKGLETTIAGRTYRDIVNDIVTLREDFPKNSNIEKVSMLGCSLGSDFSKNTLIGLKENDIETKVSSRLYDVTIEEKSGRRFTDNAYHLEEGKVLWGYKEGKVSRLDPYSDERYHVVISIAEDGSLQLDRPIENLKGDLKVRVIAGSFEQTSKVLSDFKGQLPVDASMKQISIKLGEGESDWYAQRDALSYAGLMDTLSRQTDADVLSYSISGSNRGSFAYHYKNNSLTHVGGTTGTDGRRYAYKFFDEKYSSVRSSYIKEDTDVVYDLSKTLGPKTPKILMVTDEYSLQDLLEQFKGAMEMSSTPVSEIQIITKNNAISIDEYKSMVKFLSTELGVKVKAFETLRSAHPWLSINHADSQVTLDIDARHLAETQPHNDQKLQDWDTPNQEQINKLKAESQKTKPQLANHDHQVLIQTEPDDNIKDSALKLALKHPAQTTIVQMQKDGTYRVVYGTDLDKITGRVKLSVVGYGR
ncbi:C80 family cysteine peptidase, partial [bacterium endosymbiont of Bathymodiolus sp. 5 South]|uniref:C80 family cysteine peptidase n=1 Tax=bacterium endosymbiont of Bathymodiolus sp. 5 South TaxID=1181670 RepID=UPI0011182379